MQEQERVPLKLNEPEFDNRMTIRKSCKKIKFSLCFNQKID